jgi:hypothetical protein
MSRQEDIRGFDHIKVDHDTGILDIKGKPIRFGDYVEDCQDGYIAIVEKSYSTNTSAMLGTRFMYGGSHPYKYMGDTIISTGGRTISE